VVVTDGGATDDFFNPEHGQKIKSSPKALMLREKYEGKYLEPSLGELMNCIENFIEKKSRISQTSDQNLIIFSKSHSWENVTAGLIKLL
jgi:hypothetical protein